MSNYKVLSIIQAIVIFICAVSILDYGYSLQHLLDNQTLGFNKLLFDSSSDFWNPIAFWAYMATVVGLLQLIKSFTVKIK